MVETRVAAELKRKREDGGIMSDVEQGQGLEGGCACGSVRFRLTRAPMFVHCCHCRDCQRQTGTAFVINALIETTCIEIIKGETAATRMPTDSGRPHDIYRCTACQTALWSDYGGRPRLRFVRVGTLDTPETMPPDVHIFTCESWDLICQTVSDCAALNHVECSAYSGMEALGLARTGSQAPEPRSGAPKAQGLTAWPNAKPL
jgi:hypothetical protein